MGMWNVGMWELAARKISDLFYLKDNINIAISNKTKQVQVMREILFFYRYKPFVKILLYAHCFDLVNKFA